MITISTQSLMSHEPGNPVSQLTRQLQVTTVLERVYMLMTYLKFTWGSVLVLKACIMAVPELSTWA